MDNSDKLYSCAASYNNLLNYQYETKLYNNGKIIDTVIQFDISDFMHLSGLEKLEDLPLFPNISSNRLFDNILNTHTSFHHACRSSLWNKPLNDPKKNNVTYTLEDRIATLTNFRDLLDLLRK